MWGKKGAAKWNRGKVSFHKFLSLISLHILASLKAVWKEETALFLAKNLKRKCSGTVRNGPKGREDPLSSEQLNVIYQIVLDKGHACITALGLSLSPAIQNFPCMEADWWPSAVTCSPRLWTRGTLTWRGRCGGETLAEPQADESTSCLHLTRLSWVDKGLCRSTGPYNKASV